MEIKLEIIKGPEKGKVFVLNESTTCVAGRSSEVRFRFSEDDPYISRRHFVLEAAPPKVYFRDLDVKNPSRINDCYAEEAALSEGDIIEVGYTKLKVSLKLDIPIKNIRCKKCGHYFEICNDEEHVSVCVDCDNKNKEEKQKKTASAKLDRELSIKCKCGKDLNEQANSDGRAQELTGRIIYSCERCLPQKRADGGRKIDAYELIKKVGEGGMGKVYLAYHKPTARLVALKEVNISNKHLAARFEREIRIMKKVIHDNVLCYIDSGQQKKSGKPYLVMEYASQGNLDDLLINNKGYLSPASAIKYIIHSLRGLEHVHSNGIVHRDIKPENILLTRNGKSELIPKLADFGIAREFSKAGGTVLTQLKQAMGTLLYMPPEQIKNAHFVKEPADLYSMGVTLYHLLTGKYPFEFPTPRDILKFLAKNKDRLKSPDAALRLMIEKQKLKYPHLIVLEEEPIPIIKRKPDIPSELASIVDKAIKKDVSLRFRSAADFRSQLEKVSGRFKKDIPDRL